MSSSQNGLEGQPTSDGQSSALIGAGGLIPAFKEGSGHPSPFSAGDMNLIVQYLNSLISLKIVRTDAAQNADGSFTASGALHLSKQNSILELIDYPLGASAGGTNANLNVAEFQLASIQANYWTASDGTKIAKPRKLRNSITSATIDTVAWSYAYWTDTVHRTATGPGTEYQAITPRYLVNDYILCVQFNTGLFDAGSNAIIWQDLDNSRAWSRMADQNQTPS